MFEILVGNLNEFIELPCEQWWQTIPQKHDYFFLCSFSSERTTYNELYRPLQIPIASQCTDHHANSPLFHHDN